MRARTCTYLLGAALLVAACGDDGGGTNTEEVIVTSDDGKATLTIPPGALPPGVSADDITVTALGTNDIAIDSGSLIAGYELLPDGTQLTAPAQLRIDDAIRPGRVMTVVHVPSAGSSEAPPSTIEQDEQTGEYRYVTATVSHFSQVLTFDLAATTTRVVAPLLDTYPTGPTALGIQVEAMPGEAQQIAYRNLKSGAERRFTYQWELPFTLSHGGFLLEGLRPAELTIPASPVTLTDSTVVDLPAFFWCLGTGTISARWSGIGSFAGQRTETIIPSSGSSPEVSDPEPWSYLVKPEAVSSQASCEEGVADPTDDFIDSISSNLPTFTSDAIDIIYGFARRFQMTAMAIDASYNNDGSLYRCGENTNTHVTVCTSKPQPVPWSMAQDANDQLVFMLTTLDEIHGDPGTQRRGPDASRSYIYSLVLDSDGDPANDWQFNPPFDWDLFRGTDRWYQLIWNHASQQWSLRVTQVDASQNTTDVDSTARVTIQGSTISWHISASEIPSATPGYRFTAFGHDGNFSASDRGADVSGADPTEPLLILQ